MTFEEFEQLPESEFRQELRHGELFELPPPRPKHYDIQLRLRDFIFAVAGPAAIVGTEFGFKPREQFEFWIADVAYTTRERWKNCLATAGFFGAPELVIEVLSPSNSVREMRERRTICLENGSQEFWVVDEESRSVEVFYRDRKPVEYKSGEHIPLFFAPASTLAVDQIFEEPKESA